MNVQERARAKRKLVMAHIEKHGNTPASELVRLYECSKDMAYKCLRDSGIEILSQADIRKRQGEDKKKAIVAYLRKHGALSSNDIVKKFHCGKQMACDALKVANVGSVQKRPTTHYADRLDHPMYRPNGRNLLCEAWV